MLHRIKSEKVWEEEGFHTFTEYLPSLPCTRASSYNYIRVANYLSRRDCEGLTETAALLLVSTHRRRPVLPRRRRTRLAASIRAGEIGLDELRDIVSRARRRRR